MVLRSKCVDGSSAITQTQNINHYQGSSKEDCLSKVRFERKGKTITTIKTDDEGNITRSQESFPSYNAAKRKSRALQIKEQKGLGRGVLLAD